MGSVPFIFNVWVFSKISIIALGPFIAMERWSTNVVLHFIGISYPDVRPFLAVYRKSVLNTVSNQNISTILCTVHVFVISLLTVYRTQT
jgi:hypothetical protein